MPEVPRHEGRAAVQWFRGADVEEGLSAEWVQLRLLLPWSAQSASTIGRGSPFGSIGTSPTLVRERAARGSIALHTTIDERPRACETICLVLQPKRGEGDVTNE